MRLRAEVGVDTVGASAVALIWAADSAAALISAGLVVALISAGLGGALQLAGLAGPISAVLAPVSLAALRVSTSPRPAATSAAKGISAVGVSCRALVTASMTTTTGAATATRTTQLTAAIRPPIRPRTTSRQHRARHHDHAAYQ